MKRKIKLFGLLTVCAVATLGGLYSYNFNSQSSDLLIHNVVALTDDRFENSYLEWNPYTGEWEWVIGPQKKSPSFPF